MKMNVKFLGLAVAASLTLCACNQGNQTEEDTMAQDTMATECEAVDTLLAEEDTTVAVAAAPAPQKEEVKKEEDTKKTSVKKTATINPKNNGKADAKEVAGQLKEGEGNSVEAKQLKPAKKSAKEAFGKKKSN